MVSGMILLKVESYVFLKNDGALSGWVTAHVQKIHSKDKLMYLSFIEKFSNDQCALRKICGPSVPTLMQQLLIYCCKLW